MTEIRSSDIGLTKQSWQSIGQSIREDSSDVVEVGDAAVEVVQGPVVGHEVGEDGRNPAGVDRVAPAALASNRPLSIREQLISRKKKKGTLRGVCVVLKNETVGKN